MAKSVALAERKKIPIGFSPIWLKPEDLFLIYG